MFRSSPGFSVGSSRGLAWLALRMVLVISGLAGFCAATQAAAKAPSTTTLTVTPPTATTTGVTYGTTITFSVSVAPNSAPPYPTGNVQIARQNGTPLCTIILAQGQGSCSSSLLDASSNDGTGAGHYNVAASFLTDANYLPSRSDYVAFQINRVPATISTSIAPEPSQTNQNATITAQVTVGGANATAGTVDFSDGNTTLCAGAAVAAGKATCTKTFAATGNHVIFVQYNPPDANTEASGTTINHSVLAASTTSLTITPAASLVYGQSVDLDIAVTSAYSGGMLGSVAVVDSEGVTICAPSGVGSQVSPAHVHCSARLGFVGNYGLKASYSGDDQTAPSNSALVSIEVAKADPMLSGAMTSGYYGDGQSTTLQIAFASNSGTANGTVKAHLDGYTFCTIVLPATSCATQGPNFVGTVAIALEYSGDAHFNAESVTVNWTKAKAPTATTLTSASANVQAGQPVTLTATVAVSGSGNANAPGYVSFVVDGNTLCDHVSLATPSQTKRTQSVDCIIPALDAGAHTAQANYHGNGGESDSTSNSLPLTATAGSAADMSAMISKVPAVVAPGEGVAGLTLTCANAGPGMALNAICKPVVTTKNSSTPGNNSQCYLRSDANRTPLEDAVNVAAGDAIVCTFDISVGANGADSVAPISLYKIGGTTGAQNDSNSANDTAEGVAIDVIDAVDDNVTQTAGTVSATTDVAANDSVGGTAVEQYRPGQFKYSLVTGSGTTCANASVSATGMATYSVPTRNTCTVTYAVCGVPDEMICDYATLTVTAVLGAVDGTCGAANGKTRLAAPSAPADLCTTGTASAVTSSGHPWSWTCAGTNNGSTANCSAMIQTWTVSASGNSGGTITPPSQTVDNGQTAMLTLSANDGYRIDSASGCNGSLSGSQYTTGPVNADCSVIASFASALAPTTTVLAIAPNPAKVSQQVIATVSVDGDAATDIGTRASRTIAAATAGSSVTISGDGQSCNVVLDTQGAGQCALSFTTAGTYLIRADYSGDATHAASSASVSEQIEADTANGTTVAAPMLDDRMLALLLVVLSAAALSCGFRGVDR